MNYIHDDPRRASETMYLLQAAVESANDAIIITELDLDLPGPRIEYVNPAFTQMTGYTQEEAIGSTPRFLQGPKTDRGLLDRLRNDLKTGQSFHGQTVNYRKDGSEYFVEWRITPVRDGSGTPIKWVAVQRDVTNRERAEQALRASERDLRRANQDLEQFVYSASHDLQEPIRNVAIYSQMIQRKFGDQLTPQAQLYFNYVIEGAQRVGSLVQDLLDYTRAANLDEEVKGPVDAEEVLNVVLADLAQSIQESKASITREPLPSVLMRDVHLRQIFQNLITNAIKYRKQDAVPAVHVSAKLIDSSTAQFAVRDSGIGIPPEYHEQIFGVFKRLHDRSYQGTGIGLAISQRIVERYNQKIWVDSLPGQGSTFLFTAPIRNGRCE
jgi:PAS domain S-box-containing protein